MRQKHCPAGRPGLSRRDQEKVVLGNTLLDISIDIFRLCRLHNVPFIWENPFSSYMWDMPRARAVLSWKGVEDVEVHYCGFGMPWKKPTRFRCFGIPGARSFFGRVCRSDPCFFSGLPHQRLTGLDPHGVFWTLRACAYPWELCERLAAAIVSAARMKVFALRACEIEVRNAYGVRKVDVDECPHEDRSFFGDAASAAAFSLDEDLCERGDSSYVEALSQNSDSDSIEAVEHVPARSQLRMRVPYMCV